MRQLRTVVDQHQVPKDRCCSEALLHPAAHVDQVARSDSRPPGCHRGASGFVQLALDKRTNEQVAIKFLERGGGASQRVIARELLNHRECALHPNIVQLKVLAAFTLHA